MFDFLNLAMPINITIFMVAAAIVWISGAKIAAYAEAIAHKTQVGDALIGLFLLAGITSLPEIATSFTASLSGDTSLAVNNVLGSIAMQVAVLAVADFYFGRKPLTSVVPDPVVILQGTLNICLLSLVALAVIVGEKAFLGAGLWSWGLFICALYSFWKLTEAQGRKPWVANTEAGSGDQKESLPLPKGSLSSIFFRTAIFAALILCAGALVALTGEALAEQSGIGSSFVGVAFVAIATSLPEVSTVYATMKRGLFTMAISDIFGTNILNIALIFFVDLLAQESPVLGNLGVFPAIAALLGALMTALFVMGLAERRDRKILRMGVDSLFVIIVYMGGLALLYTGRATL